MKNDYTHKRNLARIGHPKHLDKLVGDKLVNDLYWRTRYNVARKGNINHIKHLLNDEHPTVQAVALRRLKQLGGE